MTKNANAKSWTMYEWGDGSFHPYEEPDVADLPGLWTWADIADDDDTYFDLATGNNSRPVLDVIVNRATPGTNDYFNDDTGDASHGRPGYDGPFGGHTGQDGFSITGYSTSLRPLAIESYQSDGGDDAFVQHMYQTGNLNATGEFYLVSAFVNSRVAGNRYLWGQDASNYVRIEQITGDGNASIEIAGGTETDLATDGDIPDGPVLLEIWRDANDDLFMWANGVDITNGTINIPGTFAMSGFGGGEQAAGSAWDDWLLEILACNDLPNASWRSIVRSYLNNKWGLY